MAGSTSPTASERRVDVSWRTVKEEVLCAGGGGCAPSLGHVGSRLTGGGCTTHATHTHTHTHTHTQDTGTEAIYE